MSPVGRKERGVKNHSVLIHANRAFSGPTGILGNRTVFKLGPGIAHQTNRAAHGARGIAKEG